MYRNFILVIGIVLGMAFHAKAQNDEKKQRLAQVSFAFPVGSNGMNAPFISNNFSFNALWGVNGGVTGMEIGGLLNYNTGDVTGVQLAGLTNMTGGESFGFVTSGLSNFSKGDMTGVHLAGLVNTTLGKSMGLHIAGVSNVMLESSTGLYLSGVSNFSRKSMTGTQISVVNVVTDDMDGLQLGVVNVATGALKGAQIGVVNYADTVKGLQFGVVNVNQNSDNGLPFGVLTFVKDGYFAFELGVSEAHLAMLNYKMGTEKFYNIFMLGYQSNEFDNSYAYGYGLGTLLPVSEHVKVNLEAMSSHSFNHHELNAINLLNTARFRVHYNINNWMAVSAGPTYNVYVRDLELEPTEELIKHPKTLLESTSKQVRVSQWIGFSAGVIIRI